MLSGCAQQDLPGSDFSFTSSSEGPPKQGSFTCLGPREPSVMPIFIFLLFPAKEESPQVNSKLEALDANVCVGHVLLWMKRQIEISEI